MFELTTIKDYFNGRQDILLAYLFGSGAGGNKVANDLDILILADERSNHLKIQIELVNDLSKLTGFTTDRIDVVFFDQEEVDPHILKSAINHGILIKNTDPELLSNRIEKLSRYFLKNEPAIVNAKRLEKERLEVFCEG